MVSLQEAAALPRRADPRRKCGAGDWLAGLPVDERVAAGELLAQADRRERSFTEVAALFRENGLTLQENAVRVHHRGLCACPR